MNTTERRDDVNEFQPLVCANAVDDGTGFSIWATIVRGGVASAPIQVEIYETRTTTTTETPTTTTTEFVSTTTTEAVTTTTGATTTTEAPTTSTIQRSLSCSSQSLCDLTHTTFKQTFSPDYPSPIQVQRSQTLRRLQVILPQRVELPRRPRKLRPQVRYNDPSRALLSLYAI